MTTPQVLVVCESPTGNTQKMAQAVAKGARRTKEVEVALKSLKQVSADVLAEFDTVILALPPETLECHRRRPHSWRDLDHCPPGQGGSILRLLRVGEESTSPGQIEPRRVWPAGSVGVRG